MKTSALSAKCVNSGSSSTSAKTLSVILRSQTQRVAATKWPETLVFRETWHSLRKYEATWGPVALTKYNTAAVEVRCYTQAVDLARVSIIDIKKYHIHNLVEVLTQNQATNATTSHRMRLISKNCSITAVLEQVVILRVCYSSSSAWGFAFPLKPYITVTTQAKIKAWTFYPVAVLSKIAPLYH